MQSMTVMGMEDPAFLQAFQPPKQNDSKKRDDDNLGDNDDKESEKTLILGAD